MRAKGKLVEPKMSKWVQVWWKGELLDVIDCDRARQLIADKLAMQIAKNQIKMTPQW